MKLLQRRAAERDRTASTDGGAASNVHASAGSTTLHAGGVRSTRMKDLQSIGASVLFWVLVLCAPTVLAAALVAGAVQNVAAPVAASSPDDALSVEEQFAGAYASDFVAAWFRATRDDPSPLAPFVSQDLTSSLGTAPTSARDITVAVIDPQTGGIVRVLVTASIEELELELDGDAPTTWERRAFEVFVVVDAAGGLSVLGLPAPTAIPAQAEAIDLVYDVQLALDDPAASTVSNFLAAYLAGQGDLERFIAPSAEVTPILPTPYAQSDVTNVLADTSPPDASRRATLHVQAQVVATSIDGNRVPATYYLELTTRDGRWEVSALETVPITDVDPS